MAQTKPRFIEIETPSFDEGYHKCMEKNGIIKTIVNHINIDEISSIHHYKGQLLHEGWDCTKIVMKNRDVFIDSRKPNKLLDFINNH